MTYDQREYEIRCEWGLQGVAHLAPVSDAVIIVDVLSFSTSVTIAVERGALVYPYAGPPEELAGYAASRGAQAAGRRDDPGAYSLSPESLLNIPEGTRLVLPSPNGSTLSLRAQPARVLAGCLRNARAVARAAMSFGSRIAVIPAGERWWADGSLRPALEDLLGAGAILQHLPGSLSPEARAAQAVFHALQSDLEAVLRGCSSGKELIERGNQKDVRLAAQLDGSEYAPVLLDGAYCRGRD